MRATIGLQEHNTPGEVRLPATQVALLRKVSFSRTGNSHGGDLNQARPNDLDSPAPSQTVGPPTSTPSPHDDVGFDSRGLGYDLVSALRIAREERGFEDRDEGDLHRDVRPSFTEKATVRAATEEPVFASRQSSPASAQSEPELPEILLDSLATDLQRGLALLLSGSGTLPKEAAGNQEILQGLNELRQILIEMLGFLEPARQARDDFEMGIGTLPSAGAAVGAMPLAMLIRRLPDEIRQLVERSDNVEGNGEEDQVGRALARVATELINGADWDTIATLRKLHVSVQTAINNLF